MHPSSYQALLLVDGYNIIGAWSYLKNLRDHQGLQAARQNLTEVLINYSALQGFQTVLVFDAQYQNKPACQENITPYLSIYYTNFCQTADTYIEKVCANFKHGIKTVNVRSRRDPRSGRRLDTAKSRVIVATSDRAQQQTVIGYGAEWLSAMQLARDVEHTKRSSQHKYKSHKKLRGRFLANSLDPLSRQRLNQLRKGLH